MPDFTIRLNLMQGYVLENGTLGKYALYRLNSLWIKWGYMNVAT
jgi:hypothetical protein